MHNLALELTGADISPGCRIGLRFHLPHPVGVVIGGGVEIGSDVWIFAGVVLGQKRLPDEWPVLEDGAHILSGAKVLGKVRVGKRAVVGANAVAVKDVPPHTTVVGIPAEPIKRKAIDENS